MPRKLVLRLGRISLAAGGRPRLSDASGRAPVDRVADPFATGWMVVDTNGDGIADFIAGKIVVPRNARAAENAAAANFAARVGFAVHGHDAAAGDRRQMRAAVPRIRIGRSAATPSDPRSKRKKACVVSIDGNVAITWRT